MKKWNFKTKITNTGYFEDSSADIGQIKTSESVAITTLQRF